MDINVKRRNRMKTKEQKYNEAVERATQNDIAIKLIIEKAIEENNIKQDSPHSDCIIMRETKYKLGIRQSDLRYDNKIARILQELINLGIYQD